jgi:RNA polymerase sigma-70 factor (ECF subfamily)
MGAVGLTLPWGARISSVEGEGDSRVASSEVQEQEGPGGSGNPEDAAIATLCLGGDLEGYERLYRWQGTRMKNLARHLLGTQSDAEDAVQETFLKIQRSVASFRGQSSFVTWAFRILVNTCHDLRRSRVRRKENAQGDHEELPPSLEPRAAVAHPTLRLALERALVRLTQHQRDVFLLYEVEGFHHSEIANMLEITEAASKNTLFQAKKNLRGMLEPPSSRAREAGR